MPDEPCEVCAPLGVGSYHSVATTRLRPLDASRISRPCAAFRPRRGCHVIATGFSAFEDEAFASTPTLAFAPARGLSLLGLILLSRP